jgi:hypothetical protein
LPIDEMIRSCTGIAYAGIADYLEISGTGEANIRIIGIAGVADSVGTWVASGVAGIEIAIGIAAGQTGLGGKVEEGKSTWTAPLHHQKDRTDMRTEAAGSDDIRSGYLQLRAEISTNCCISPLVVKQALATGSCK